MAPGCVPSSLQTNLSILAASKKRKGSPQHSQREKAVANEERIYNFHLGLLRTELCTLDTAQGRKTLRRKLRRAEIKRG